MTDRREAFVARYGGVYEHSPWVAQRAWDGGANPDGSLAPVFRRVVDRAGAELQLALLHAHPDLAGRVTVGSLTASSAAEQAAAGLDACTQSEFAEFGTLNQRYTARFGFPFIIAVAGLDRGAILAAFRRRVDCALEAEFVTALEEVHRIAGLRLAALARPTRTPSRVVSERREIEYDALVRLVDDALRRHGADEPNAAAIAATVCAAERDGSVSHGLFRVPGYVTALESGVLDGRARPRILAGEGAVVRVDGDGGAAPFAYTVALPELAARASSLGAAVLSLTRAAHFAALWHEVEWLAERGLAAFACTANFPYLAPAGGSAPAFGTNPLSFAVPAAVQGEPPLVIDMAASAMARGDIMMAAAEGRAVPEGVGIGPDGAPTTDASAILTGAQLPFGGHKGSALALMVELLAGLCGGPYSDVAADRDGSGVPVGSVFVLAMTPEALGGPDAITNASAFLRRLSSQPGIRLPGTRRHATRVRPGPLQVDANLLAQVRRLAGG